MYVYIQLSSYISYTCYVGLPFELMILSEELKKRNQTNQNQNRDSGKKTPE